MLVIVSRNTTNGSLRYMMTVFPLFLFLSMLVSERKLAYNLLLYVFVFLHLFYFIGFVNFAHWAHT
jgi:hypothetical protein